MPRRAALRPGTDAPHRRTWSFAALLAALSMIGPFSIDTYLPAFHTLEEQFSTSRLAIQQTLSIYMLTYAFMMLWHGALSDALGRKSVVVGSLTVYALATMGCAIAGNIETLWLFRGLQGTCAGAGMVVARAIVRDRFHGAEAQRLMSQTTLVFGLAPALAPVLGGVLLNTLGWRSIFWFMFAAACALVGLCIRKLPETLPPASRQSLRPGRLWHSYVDILGRPSFLLLACIPALNFAAFFIYIAAAPAYLIDLLGVSSYGFAWLFVPMISGVMIGAFVSGRFAGRFAPQQSILRGYAVILTGASLNLLVTSLGSTSVLLNVVPIMIFTAGSSIVMPSATLLLLDLFPTKRGLASSLQGFVHFSLAALVAGTIAPLLAVSLSMLAFGMATFAGLGFLLWTLYRRHAAYKPVDLIR